MSTWLSYQATQTNRFKTLLQLSENLGYMLIEPPYFIDYDDFRNEQPFKDPRGWIKLSNPEGRVLVLRPDLTTSVMDQLQWKPTDGPLKVSYYASTFFQTQHRLESQKEFGFEYFNAPSVAGETHIVKTLEAFNQTFKLSLILEVSHTDVFKKIITLLNLKESSLNDLKTLFKNKSFDALEDWFKTQSFSENEQNLIKAMTQPYPSLKDFNDVLLKTGFETEFKLLLSSLKPFETLLGYEVVFDFSGMSDWSYYEGVMFQVFEETYPKPLLKGGRYRLRGMQGEAIGCSLKLDDLIEVTL